MPWEAGRPGEALQTEGSARSMRKLVQIEVIHSRYTQERVDKTQLWVVADALPSAGPS